MPQCRVTANYDDIFDISFFYRRRLRISNRISPVLMMLAKYCIKVTGFVTLVTAKYIEDCETQNHKQKIFHYPGYLMVEIPHQYLPLRGLIQFYFCFPYSQRDRIGHFVLLSFFLQLFCNYVVLLLLHLTKCDLKSMLFEISEVTLIGYSPPEMAFCPKI